jgi:hypothetical protein
VKTASTSGIPRGGSGDRVDVGAAGEADLHERLDRPAERGVVDLDRVAGDHAQSLEAIDAPLDRRRPEADAPPDVGQRAPGVALGEGEDLVAVDAALTPPAAPSPDPDPRATGIVDAVGADGELRRLLEVRVPELIACALVGEYGALIADALERLDAGTAGVVAQLADLPDLVRGYEDIKLRNVERFRARAQEMAGQLDRAYLPPQAAGLSPTRASRC